MSWTKNLASPQPPFWLDTDSQTQARNDRKVTGNVLLFFPVIDHYVRLIFLFFGFGLCTGLFKDPCAHACVCDCC